MVAQSNSCGEEESLERKLMIACTLELSTVTVLCMRVRKGGRDGRWGVCNMRRVRWCTWIWEESTGRLRCVCVAFLSVLEVNKRGSLW
ncbi:hypothetical protein E2C01_101874 [Portunus trituberculatus]|uniref:Uncharacterized protein n=1 Tax=Portunus trituberculatus TaxID=210409 RepID=A0A5B7KLE3_PORTR|nr:hypothetical protein [Portunus trituberculatus]